MRTIDPNPDTEPMYAAVADYKRKFGLVETLRKLQMMTEATRERWWRINVAALRP